MSKKRVLITGMSGLIGGIVRRHLELDGKYELSALNRRAVQGVVCYQADIADFNAIQPAFEGKDIVVHLAAASRIEATWEEILPTNIIGTYNVFEASRRAGVKRIVYASSGAVISNCEIDFPYSAIAEGKYDELDSFTIFTNLTNFTKLTHESPVRPKGLYGCSKVWGEALARYYSDAYGMSIICLRIGAVNSQDRPLEPRQFSVWCSQRDVAQMVHRCIEAPDDVRFDIFYVTSNNKWSYRDLDHAREVVGFEPQDAAEDYRGETNTASERGLS